MPVVVTKTGGKEEMHEDGTHFELKDGHLIVNYPSGTTYRPLAVYIPGSWVKAVVNKKQA